MMEHTDLHTLIEYSRNERVKKDIIKTSWVNVVLICLETGQEIPPHPEPYAVLFHVLDGEGTITIGATRYDVRPGHLIFSPKGGVRGISPRTRMSLLGMQEPH
jgi:quercetin dioxygenase-like cupin family protein